MKNLGRKFATMSDDERRRFAQEQGRTAAGAEDEDAADELELGDPREPDRMAPPTARSEVETGDPDARDGDAALLDDTAHRRAVKRASAAKRTRKGRRHE